MPIRLVRHPRSLKRVHPLVRHEVSVAYAALAETVISLLLDEVADYSTKPEFEPNVSVGTKKWKFEIKLDKRKKANKLYVWQRDGTGPRANEPKPAFDIFPKKAPVLRYDLPSIPKIYPDNGQIAPSSLAEPGTVYRGAVLDHPGIYPRNHGKKIVEKLKTRTSGSFHNVTEAAIKRGLRKKQGGGQFVV